MKLKNEIENVRAFLPNKDIVIKDNEIISLKNNEIAIIEEAYRLFDLDNEILVLDDMNVPYIFDTNIKLIRKFSDFEVNAVKYPFIEFYYGKAPRTYGILDYKKNQKLFEVKEIIGRDIIDNYIFTDDITCRNINNGEILWHFDIPTIPNNPQDDEYDKTADWEVKKFIGVLENKLWVALNHHTIIGLDIETGKLVHQIHDMPTFKSEWLPSAVPHSEATVIDEKSNKLIGFMWEFYWEINPQNGEITLFDLTEDFQSQKIRNDLQDFVLTDSHIYFASHHDIKVAAFNRTTKQIDWYYAFEDNGIDYQSRIKKIDGNYEKLGVLTQENILYIFEKE